MATIIFRNRRYCVRVRVKGQPAVTQTFHDRKQACRWGAETEDAIRRGIFEFGKVIIPTLAAALATYKKTVTINKRGAAIEAYVINIWLQTKLAHLTLDAINVSQLAALRDTWIVDRTPSTLQKRFALLSHLFEVARRDWHMPLANPVKELRKPEIHNQRTRRVSDAELHAVLAASDSPTLDKVAPLALATGARLGELVGAQWRYVDVQGKALYLPLTKNGESRTVPLSPDAIAICKGLTRRLDGGQVFAITSHGISAAWARAVKRARLTYERQCLKDGKPPAPEWLTNLHFHDLRHEAISRLAEGGFSTLELAGVSGHKSLSMLKRYTHISAGHLAERMAALA